MTRATLTIDKIKEIMDIYSNPKSNTISLKEGEKIVSCMPNSLHMLLQIMRYKAQYIETDDFIYIVEYGNTVTSIISKNNKLVDTKVLQGALNLPDVKYVGSIPINLKGIAEFNAGDRSLYRYYLYQARDMIELEGKHFKNIRKQLNKVNKDVEDSILRIEYYTLADIPEAVINDIMALVHKWKGKRVTSKNRYVRAVIDMTTNDYKEHYRSFKDVHIVAIRHIANNNIITYGVDHLLGNNVIVLTEGKFDTDYAEDYPDINKLINHFEVKNMVEKYNLDIDKATFTLDLDPGNESQSYYDYKRRLAPCQEVLLGTASRSNKISKYISVVFNGKKSIF